MFPNSSPSVCTNLKSNQLCSRVMYRIQKLIHIYSVLIFDWWESKVQCRKNDLFNEWCWINWIFIRKTIHYLSPNLTPLPKINSMWIANLNINGKKCIGKHTNDITVSKVFLHRTQKPYILKMINLTIVILRTCLSRIHLSMKNILKK